MGELNIFGGNFALKLEKHTQKFTIKMGPGYFWRHKHAEHILHNTLFMEFEYKIYALTQTPSWNSYTERETKRTNEMNLFLFQFIYSAWGLNSKRYTIN